jgi:hypothetical protein
MTLRMQRLVSALTALGWLALVVTIAAHYVGHSSSPYGACYAPSGREVPCQAVARK